MADDKNAAYHENVKAVCKKYDETVTSNIIKYLGIALRTSRDAATVACSDKSELERIREGFMKKKLALSDSDSDLDKALKEVCEQMGTSNKNKCRVAFYFLIAEKYSKISDLA